AKFTSRVEAAARGLSDFTARDTSLAYTFVAPAFFLLLFLVAYPFVLSVWFSVSDARVGETGSFVGLANFERLLGSDIFRQTLKNSLVFTSIALLLKTVLGMALALLLFRVARFKRLIRGAVDQPLEPGDPEQQQRSEEHTSELQSPDHLVCRLLLENKQ